MSVRTTMRRNAEFGTGPSIRFPMWVKTTRCTQRTRSYMRYDRHGVTQEFVKVDVPR